MHVFVLPLCYNKFDCVISMYGGERNEKNIAVETADF